MKLTILSTLVFDVPSIKYGLVSYGFKNTHQCMLANTSLVPMSFNLRVASDSEARDFAQSDQDEYNFKEFSIVPSQGIIPPQSEIKILVEFVPHFIKKYETYLVVDIENVSDELFQLPVSAISTVPQITILTPDIDLGRCFIYHSYERQIQLQNDTSLKARYYLLPSKPNDTIKFSSGQAEGVIEANSVKYVSVLAESLQLGDIQSDLLIKINGSVEPPLKCNFICISQGPVCQILPKEIDWGLTTVLQKSARDIKDQYVHVVFLATNDQKHQVCIYVSASRKLAMNCELSDAMYVKFLDVLNTEGLALISGKNKTIDKLITEINLLSKCGKVCTGCYGYPDLPQKVYKNFQNNFQVFYDCLVTEVGHTNNRYYVWATFSTMVNSLDSIWKLMKLP